MMNAARQNWLGCVFICLLLMAGTSCSRWQDDRTVEDAIQAFNDGDEDLAQEIFASYLASHPDSVEALRARGGIHNAMGRTEQALKDLNRALEIDPHDGVALHNRALVFLDLDRKEEAIADFEEAIVCGFDRADMRNRLGLLYSKTDRMQKAIEHYGEAIRLNPFYLVYYLNRGGCLVHVGKFDEGIADFTSAIELAPDDYNAYALRYNAYVQKGELEKARPDGEKAHQLNPEWKMWAHEDKSVAKEIQL